MYMAPRVSARHRCCRCAHPPVRARRAPGNARRSAAGTRRSARRATRRGRSPSATAARGCPRPTPRLRHCRRPAAPRPHWPRHRAQRDPHARDPPAHVDDHHLATRRPYLHPRKPWRRRLDTDCPRRAARCTGRRWVSARPLAWRGGACCRVAPRGVARRRRARARGRRAGRGVVISEELCGADATPSDELWEALPEAALNHQVMDPYEILGITPAYEGDLRARRNLLVKRYFEAGKTPDEERMKAINLAYERLSDPARRRAATAPGPLSIATAGL